MSLAIGPIENPLSNLAPGIYDGTQGEGLITLLSTIIQFTLVVAGIYTFLNLILAGLAFISAGGEPKNIAKAWAKIWQSIVGLLIVAGSFLLAVIVGYLIYGPDNAFLLIQPRIFAP